MNRNSLVLPAIALVLVLGSSCKREPGLEHVGRFYSAILEKDKNKVEYYLRHYKNIAMWEMFEKQGNAAMAAIAAGDLDILRLVVEAGAAVNYVEVIGNSVLMLAIEGGNPEIVKYLLECGADPYHKNNNGVTVYHYLSQFPNMEIAELLKDKAPAIIDDPLEDGTTALMYAVNRRNLDLIGYFVGMGASTNKIIERSFDFTSTLIMHNENAMLKLLFENARGKVHTTNQYNANLLHIALWLENWEIVPFIVEHIPDINEANKDGETPLHAAAQHPNAEVIEFLISNGADVNRRDKKGMTPLEHYRSNPKNTDPEIIELLSSSKGAPRGS